MDDLVERLKFVAAALAITLRRNACVVVGFGVLGGVDEKFAVTSHEGVVIVIADGKQTPEGTESVEDRGRFVRRHVNSQVGLARRSGRSGRENSSDELARLGR